MAKHKMELDDQTDRTVLLNTELSSHADISFTIVYKKDTNGNLVNFAVIKSKKPKKAFADLEVPADGIKIPPDIDSPRP